MVTAMAVEDEERSGADLISRCKAVKWKNKDTKDGILFTLPKGQKFLIPEVFPTAQARREAEDALMELGLESEERAQDRSQQTLDRLESKERRAPGVAFSAADAAAKKALVRAAGNYLVEFEDPGIQWFVAPHPAPLHKWVYVTAEICRYLLEHHNKPGAVGLPGTNRPQSEARIGYFRDLVISGQWMPVHQGMAMDVGGEGPGRDDDRPMVQDGQQRMAGIVAAQELIDMLRSAHSDGVSLDELANGSRVTRERIEKLLAEPTLKVPCSFFVGMPLEYFEAVDDVLLREARHLFTMRGEKNGATLQSASRLIMAHAAGGNVRSRLRQRQSNMSVTSMFYSDADVMRKAASVANAHASRKAYTTPSAFAAAYYLIASANGPDNRYVEAFFGGLLSGVKHNTRTTLDEDDPRKVYRRVMHDYKMRGVRPVAADQMGMIIWSWNNMVRGNHVVRMKWTLKETPIPEPLICQDRGEGASAVPRALVGEILDLFEDEDEVGA